MGKKDISNSTYYMIVTHKEPKIGLIDKTTRGILSFNDPSITHKMRSGDIGEWELAELLENHMKRCSLDSLAHSTAVYLLKYFDLKLRTRVRDD